jgi:hypothetical protein
LNLVHKLQAPRFEFTRPHGLHGRILMSMVILPCLSCQSANYRSEYSGLGTTGPVAARRWSHHGAKWRLWMGNRRAGPALRPCGSSRDEGCCRAATTTPRLKCRKAGERALRYVFSWRGREPFARKIALVDGQMIRAGVRCRVSRISGPESAFGSRAGNFVPDN